MTTSTYIFNVEDSTSTPITFKANPEAAQMLLNALGVYWHDDEGLVKRDGNVAWAGKFIVGNSDFSNFVEGIQ